MKQRAGCNQIALVQHALRQRVGVYAGLDPAKQPRRLRRKGASARQRELDAAGAGQIEPAANALGKAVAELLGQGLRGGFHQHGVVLMLLLRRCADKASDAV
jgi:hypothetical protein